MTTLLAIDWGFLIEKLILIIAIISISMVIAMYETYAERKVAGWIQLANQPIRIRPHRAGVHERDAAQVSPQRSADLERCVRVARAADRESPFAQRRDFEAPPSA